MSERFHEWAILELMGHRRLAGRVEDVEVFGTRMCRIDVPSEPPTTQFYSAGAIYAVTPTTEAVCRSFAARQGGPAPIQRWELPAATQREAEEVTCENCGADYALALKACPDCFPGDEAEGGSHDVPEAW